MQREVSVARHRGRQDFARRRLTVGFHRVAERIEPLELGIEMDLLRPTRARAGGNHHACQSKPHVLSIITGMQINLGQAQGTMAAIAAAVTPVVMISANAILIGTIGAKHQAMSDRLRALTAEWRDPETSAARRDTIHTQVRLFTSRIAWISRAHFLLYAATVFFLAMVIVIALAPEFSLPLLLGGVTLMLIAIVLELLDLRRAQASIELETRDV